MGNYWQHYVGFGTVPNTMETQVLIAPRTGGTVGLTIRPSYFGTQTSDLMQVLSADGTAVLRITAAGALSGNIAITLDKILLDDGTAAIPTLSFDSDENTGLFLAAADQLGIAVSGTLAVCATQTSWQFQNDMRTLISSAAVATPGLAFVTDVDTGLYQTAVNTLNIAASGAMVAAITNGAITMQSGQQMVVSSAALATPGLVLDTAGRGTGFYSAAINTFDLAASGAMVMRVTNGFTSMNTGQRFVVCSGTVATPGLEVDTAQRGTGLYSPAVNTFMLAASGSEVAQVSKTAFTLSNANSVQIVAASGAVATPGITFAGDTQGTGFYSTGVNTLDIAVSGVMVASMISTGLRMQTGTILTTCSGSVASPGLAVDTAGRGTGFYSTAVNSFVIAASGAAIAAVANGGVTMQTGQQMTLMSGSAAVPGLCFANDLDTGIYNAAVGEIAIGVAGAAMIYSNAKDVGVRTATPAFSATGASGVDIAGNAIRVRTALTPANSADIGDAGTVVWDADHIHICTVTGSAGAATWKSIVLSGFSW